MELPVSVLVGLGLVLALVLANVGVSLRVLRYSGSTRQQKAFQSAIVWLLPVLGAALVWGVLRSDIEGLRTSGSLELQGDQGIDAPESHRLGLPHVDH